jgi:hypothetical protein
LIALDIGHSSALIEDETPLPNEVLNKLAEAIFFIGNHLEWLCLRFIDEFSNAICAQFWSGFPRIKITTENSQSISKLVEAIYFIRKCLD